MRGKRRYVFIRFYSPHSALGSLTLALVPPSPKGEGFKTVNFLQHHFDRHVRADSLVLLAGFTVISTGVRTIVRTQWRNPPRERYFIRVRLFSFLLRGISRRGTRAGEWAGAGTYRAVSIVGDCSINARNDKEILLKKTRFPFCRSVFCVYSVKCGVERCADRASQALSF